MMTAVWLSASSLSRRLSSVVLPAPRKPVRTVSGSGSGGRRRSALWLAALIRALSFWIESRRWPDILLEHDLFRKPLPTFRNHALVSRTDLRLRRAFGVLGRFRGFDVCLGVYLGVGLGGGVFLGGDSLFLLRARLRGLHRIWMVGRAGEHLDWRLGLDRRPEHERAVRRPQAGQHEGLRRPAVAVDGRGVLLFFVIVFRRRLAAMAAAHFFAQVGRLRIDRRQGVDGAERWREPGETATVEAALE